MNLDLFQKKLELMCRRWRQKIDENQASILYERIRFIPDEPFNEIVEQMIEEMRYFPLIGDFKRAWDEWLISHPERVMNEPEEVYECSICDGSGVIGVRIYTGIKYHGKPIWYDHAFPCGYCKNFRRIFSIKGPSSIKRGFRKEDIERYCSKKGWDVRFPEVFQEDGNGYSEKKSAYQGNI